MSLRTLTMKLCPAPTATTLIPLWYTLCEILKKHAQKSGNKTRLLLGLLEQQVLHSQLSVNPKLASLPSSVEKFRNTVPSCPNAFSRLLCAPRPMLMISKRFFLLFLTSADVHTIGHAKSLITTRIPFATTLQHSRMLLTHCTSIATSSTMLEIGSLVSS